jgi:hypothetical protein
VSGLIFGKQGLAAIQKRREEGVDTEHSAAEPQPKAEYFAQRRKACPERRGRKGKTIPDLAFLAPWRE